MMQEQKLQRKLSPLNVWSLAFGSVIGASAFFLPGNSFLGKAGILGSGIAIMIGAAIMIVISINYSFMIDRYPVAGGEFTYSKNAFGKKHGFLCAWFLALAYFVIVPVNATVIATIFRNLFGSLFQFGFHYSIAGYDIYLGEILLAAIPIILFCWLSIRGVQFSGLFQTILVLLLLFGVGILVIAAIMSEKISITGVTTTQLWGSEISKPLVGILCVAVISPYLFEGFDTIPQAAEEFSFSHKKSKAIMLMAILFGALVYIALNTVTGLFVPEGFSDLQDYISQASKANGIIALPTFNVTHEVLGTFGIVLIGVAAVAAALTGIIGFYMATSRLLYSMAMEKIIPEKFGKLHEKYNTPYVAIIFIFVLSMIAPFFGRTAFGWLVDMSATGAAIGYGYTSLAAFKFAKQEKRTGVMVTGLVGTLFAVILLALLLIPIPVINCSLNKEQYICLFIWIVLGIVFYLSRKHSKAV